MNRQLSVVIPTFHRPDLLTRCLAGVLAQTMDGKLFEVIVVDDGHDNETRHLVETMSREWALRGHMLRYVRPPRGCGPAVARNAGWRSAQGELIAFTDDDTEPQPDWLAEGQRAMSDHVEWSALAGKVIVPLDTESRARPTDHQLMTMGLESADFVTANAFVRLAALQTIDGFDENFKRAWREDSDLEFRLIRDVGPVGRSDTAIVLHPVRPERWGVCLRQQRNAFFDALLYKKHRRTYRHRIQRTPPWNYYAIVLCAVTMVVAAILANGVIASVFGALAGLLILQVAIRRVRKTSRSVPHVAEMFATSALIPFLSVYWRLRGSVYFRVWFL
jgi:glycosyltransferase involved in cell wall biosynthesis